jgi:cephalosporin hydroxylase
MLDELAIKYGTDKSSKEHNYTPIYEELFGNVRDGILKVLEIGVKKGASLKMWQDYFPNACIYGLDIEERVIDGERIFTKVADQSKSTELINALDDLKDFDIIIDDGSHKKEHQLVSLETLLPYLNSVGVYIIEDLYDDTFPLKGYKHWFATAGNSIPKGKKCGNTLAIIKK